MPSRWCSPAPTAVSSTASSRCYERSLPVADATGPDALLAYVLNGVALPPQHGFPLRLIVPGWYGMTNVKWLTTIAAVDRPFAGYQQSVSYRLRQDDDEPGDPADADPPPGAHGPARDPGLLHPRPSRRRR